MAFAAATTAGSANSRATIAVCDNTLPVSPAAIGSHLILGGPDALSWSDIVAKTSRILDSPVSVRSIEPGEPIARLPPPLDQMAGGLAASLEQQDVIIDSTEIAKRFAVTLTSAEAAIRRALSTAR